MDFKKKALGLGARILRIAGIILVIYVSMVFYLALTERRNAFPRAITHKEAREAIASTAKPITCTVEDGTVLEGWAIGNRGDRPLLYYPDADEDAAQFLAEVQSLDGTALLALTTGAQATTRAPPRATPLNPTQSPYWNAPPNGAAALHLLRVAAREPYLRQRTWARARRSS